MSEDRYQQLLELTRLQAQLVREERIVEAVAVGEAWKTLAGQLPAQAPPHAEAFLVEAAALVSASEAALAAHASALAGAIQHVGRGRHAIASYAKA